MVSFIIFGYLCSLFTSIFVVQTALKALTEVMNHSAFTALYNAAGTFPVATYL